MGKAKKLCAPKPNTAEPGYSPRFHKVKAEPLVVIVVPTRELAMQIWDEARRMCYRSMLRPCVVYGGLPMPITFDELGKGCDILIATPGRLCDLMDKPHILTMSRVKYMLSFISLVAVALLTISGTLSSTRPMRCSTPIGLRSWRRSCLVVVSNIPLLCWLLHDADKDPDTNEDADHIYMMYSATFPKGAREMARQYMSEDYFRIRVGRPGQAHKNIRQAVVYVDHDQKREAVFDLLFSMEPGRTLIFCNAKPTVDLLDDFLYNRGLPTTSIHSDRNQREREDAMQVTLIYHPHFSY